MALFRAPITINEIIILKYYSKIRGGGGGKMFKFSRALDERGNLIFKISKKYFRLG